MRHRVARNRQRQSSSAHLECLRRVAPLGSKCRVTAAAYRYAPGDLSSAVGVWQALRRAGVNGFTNRGRFAHSKSAARRMMASSEPKVETSENSNPIPSAIATNLFANIEISSTVVPDYPGVLRCLLWIEPARVYRRNSEKIPKSLCLRTDAPASMAPLAPSPRPGRWKSPSTNRMTPAQCRDKPSTLLSQC